VRNGFDCTNWAEVKLVFLEAFGTLAEESSVTQISSLKIFEEQKQGYFKMKFSSTFKTGRCQQLFEICDVLHVFRQCVF